ncbi:MAG: molybdate ABC transporter substrate-binding protein [Armatimonadetes bacterium]|nr:molybdate ABC transporter substrate-binding protein [Armatimonadota bacterium]
MAKHLWMLLAVCAGLAGLTGCPKPQAQVPSPQPDQANMAMQGEITVFVPCGIAGPYGETKKLFEQRYPNIKVKHELANIDVQARLLAEGKAQPDVWLCLGDREMERVQKAGNVDGEPVTYAYNSVAMLVQKGNPRKIESLQDLTKPEIKTIALATPENSNGYYGEQALRKSGVWDQVEKKLWRTAEPVKLKEQLLAGKADAAIVYYPCTRETHIVAGRPQEVPGKLQLLGKIPTELSGPIPAQAAVIKGAKNPEAGRAFLAMLAEAAVQDAWEKFAFDRAVKDPNRINLYMYCGAGIRPMMDPAVEAFKQIKPNVRIDVGYAGSGCLLSQLAFSRRGDLYVPGEDFYVKQAQERGYLTDSKPVGYFEPVMLVQKGNPEGIKTVADLARPGLKVGLGEPQAAAVGLAADTLLTKAKLLDQVNKNVVYRAGNVPELGNAVKLKSLDVAIVWNVTAAQLTKDCDSLPIDRSLYELSLVPIGLLKYSEHTPEAQAFIDFLTGPEGQKIVTTSGMTPAANK